MKKSSNNLHRIAERNKIYLKNVRIQFRMFILCKSEREKHKDIGIPEDNRGWEDRNEYISQ